MVLDTELLEEARAARSRMIDLEFEAERARLNFQHAIRRLHAAGGSLREIAEALGISHQRVHQIVEGVDGKVSIKGTHSKMPWRRRRGAIACSFCGRSREDVGQVIAGPGSVYICDGCIASASELAAGGAGKRSDDRHFALASESGSACSFCGKGARAGMPLVEHGGVRICGACLNLCDEILVQTGS